MSAGNDETRLYGLMEVAEQQQAVVQAALESFAAERAAWERERERLAREVRELQLTTQGTVRSAVKESLAGAAESAGQAGAALREMALWASGRLLRRTVLAIAMVILLGWLANMAVLWWDAGALPPRHRETRYQRLRKPVTEQAAPVPHAERSRIHKRFTFPRPFSKQAASASSLRISW